MRGEGAPGFRASTPVNPYFWLVPGEERRVCFPDIVSQDGEVVMPPTILPLLPAAGGGVGALRPTGFAVTILVAGAGALPAVARCSCP